MELQRNDTTYPEIVELSAWEWCDVPMDLATVHSRGFESSPRLVQPCQHIGSYVQWKRADARPMRPCNSPPDGVESARCQKKVSLYRGYF